MSRVDLFTKEVLECFGIFVSSGSGPRVDELDLEVGELQDVTEDAENVVAQKVIKKDRGNIPFHLKLVGGFSLVILVEGLVVRVAKDATLNEPAKGLDEVHRVGKELCEVLRIDEFVELMVVVRQKLDTRKEVDRQELDLKVEAKRRH